MDPETRLPSPGPTAPEYPLMDEPTSWLRLLVNLLMIPVGLALLVPLAILVALWFYLAACKEGVRLAFGVIIGRRGDASGTRVLPAPHFSETSKRSTAKDAR